MFSRTHQQRLRYEASRCQLALEQLQLRWLCPALLGPKPAPSQPRRPSTTVADARRPLINRIRTTPKLPTPLRQPSRRYAYSATDGFAIPQENPIPFDTSQYPPSPQQSTAVLWYYPPSASSLPHFDPSTPLIVENDQTSKLRRLGRSGEGHIGGDPDDLRSTAMACLAVGNSDRAGVIIKRLHRAYPIHSVELTDIHNEYIGYFVNKIYETRDQESLKQLQRWFEVDLRGEGVEPNGLTYALMIQAAFYESNQRKIDRTIRRYLEIAKQTGAWDETMAVCFEILTGQQAGHLTEIRPSSIPNEVVIGFSPEYEDISLTMRELPSASTSELTSVEQRGLGLTSLKESLRVFTDFETEPSLETFEGTLEEKQRALGVWKQRKLERDTALAALQRWKRERADTNAKGGLQFNQGRLGALIWSWQEALTPLIRDEIERIRGIEKITTFEDHQNKDILPFLEILSPEQLAAITIIETLQRACRQKLQGMCTVADITTKLGKTIEQEGIADLAKRRQKKLAKRLGNSRFQSRAATLPSDQKMISRMIQLSRARVKMLKQHDSGSPENTLSASELRLLSDREWSLAVRSKVGAMMVTFLLKVAKINVPVEEGSTQTATQPALSHELFTIRGRRCGVIKLSNYMMDFLSREPVNNLMSKHLPMIVEPRPWTGHNEGGFYESKVPVIRTSPRTPKQMKDYIVAASTTGDLAQVWKGLDVLGRTPWKINHDVFRVMTEVWNSGEGVANISPANPKVDYPPEPSPEDPLEARKKYSQEVRHLDNVLTGLHSERCFQNFQLEVARAFLNETIYFPHNIDFRGRAYPIPPYLNHMGADHCRGLLLFADGKELGENGLNWLKVHLSNVFGFDKASLIDRRDFATNHLEEVYDSAAKPLSGRKWWLKAEDPWQCLATCFEIRNALESPDPTKFVSHMPVHQDGTCNGLQHYAALGGDLEGARQVNLVPGDKPSDIYSAVASRVEAAIAEDAAAGDELAKRLEGRIARRVVKQTVMTNVYGVTFQGARKQVARQLEDLCRDEFGDDFRTIWMASSYIAKQIFKALSNMFSGAHGIQYWLAECASRISESLTPEQIALIEEIHASGAVHRPKSQKVTKSIDEQTRFKSSVIWTTPLKMPVVQPYHKNAVQFIKTNLQEITLTAPATSDPVSKRKQVQAFPPNFIHSLDATHMILSALRCDELGLSFAAVHDSFWTHAADIDTMNAVLRDAFIRMHNEDIIGRLNTEFSARYKDCMYLASMTHHSTIGKKIHALRTEQRKAGVSSDQQRMHELVLERRRLYLLASKDPAERKAGQEMVTPASLFTEASEDDKAVVEKLETAIENVELAGEDVPSESDLIDDELASSFGHNDEYLSDTLDDGCDAAGNATEVDPEMVGHRQERSRWKKKVHQNRKSWLWLPLTFPPVPKKGDFDISTLRASKYFFS